MGSITYTGSDLRRYGNSWATDGMAQGAYGSYASGASQRGRCTFSELSSFDLTKYKITSFSITFHFLAAGGRYAKWMVLFFDNGTNENYQITNKQTDGEAYDATKTLTYSDESDITKLENAIRAGNNYLTSYNGETQSGGSGYSSNYCKMDSASLTINYENICLGHIYDSSSSSWKTCPIWVYKASDSKWHQVINITKY